MSTLHNLLLGFVKRYWRDVVFGRGFASGLCRLGVGVGAVSEMSSIDLLAGVRADRLRDIVGSLGMSKNGGGGRSYCARGARIWRCE